MHQSKWVGFIDLVAMMMRLDVKLVECALADCGNKTFPDPGTSPRAQAVHLGMPLVETTDDRNFACIRSPHAETGAGFFSRGKDVGAHLLVSPIIAAFVEEIQVLLGEQRDVVADGAGGSFDALRHVLRGSPALLDKALVYRMQALTSLTAPCREVCALHARLQNSGGAPIT